MPVLATAAECRADYIIPKMDEVNIVPPVRMPSIPPRPCRAAGAAKELAKDIICVARVKPEHSRCLVLPNPLSVFIAFEKQATIGMREQSIFLLLKNDPYSSYVSVRSAVLFVLLLHSPAVVGAADATTTPTSRWWAASAWWR